MAALLSEMELRKDYLKGEPVETIYFGGGTPSWLPPGDHAALIEKAHATFNIAPNAEITFETNPDDVSDGRLNDWKAVCPETGTYSLVGGRWNRATAVPRQRPTQLCVE